MNVFPFSFVETIRSLFFLVPILALSLFLLLFSFCVEKPGQGCTERLLTDFPLWLHKPENKPQRNAERRERHRETYSATGNKRFVCPLIEIKCSFVSSHQQRETVVPQSSAPRLLHTWFLSITTAGFF